MQIHFQESGRINQCLLKHCVKKPGETGYEFGVCDTNVFISAFNGISDTAEALKTIGNQNVLMSSITVMELLRGMSNKEDLSQMLKKIKTYNILDFNEQVSKSAIELVQKFKLSNDLQIPDAIIAASCIVYELPLFTYNVKDFRFIKEVKLYK